MATILTIAEFAPTHVSWVVALRCFIDFEPEQAAGVETAHESVERRLEGRLIEREDDQGSNVVITRWLVVSPVAVYHLQWGSDHLPAPRAHQLALLCHSNLFYAPHQLALPCHITLLSRVTPTCFTCPINLLFRVTSICFYVSDIM